MVRDDKAMREYPGAFRACQGVGRLTRDCFVVIQQKTRKFGNNVSKMDHKRIVAVQRDNAGSDCWQAAGIQNFIGVYKRRHWIPANGMRE